VYCSNESPQDVYFDDIQITHQASPLVQENSYYPYGLPMQAISDKAALKANTPYKYNAGAELEEDGVDYYHTFYRKYDAQIGRFTGVDIYADMYADLNPYQYAANNPVLFNDPNGDQIPASGRSKVNVFSKGPDGNTHISWYSELLWNNLGFFDSEVGIGQAYSGGGGSGIYVNALGINSNQVLEGLKNGYKYTLNKKTGQYGYWHYIKPNDWLSATVREEEVTVRSIRKWEYGNVGSFGGVNWFGLMQNGNTGGNNWTSLMQTGDRGGSTDSEAPLLKFVGLRDGWIPEFETSLLVKKDGSTSAFTAGPFIVYPTNGSKEPHYNQHEPGHVIQFLLMGTYYYPVVALPSVISVLLDPEGHSSNPSKYPWEEGANQLWKAYNAIFND
jgi:RHS repeat-associated protein